MMNLDYSRLRSRKVEVWVPHRISGFFQMMNPNIPLPHGDFSKVGSRGGGPALAAFGKTKISIINLDHEKFNHSKKNLIITINGKESTAVAKTSESVVKQMMPLLPENINLLIEHDFDLPLGAGFGSSGAGALGIAYGLKYLFELNLTDLEVAKFAHIAEVINHTGLGTVGGQFYGGLSITMEPGYPFKMKKIPIPKNLEIVVGSFGPISTKQILTNPEYKLLIHQVGKQSMELMKKQFTVENFMRVCRFFLEKTELLSRLNLSTLQNIINAMDDLPIYGITMNQIGDSFFCLNDKKLSQSVKKKLKQFNPVFGPKIVQICNHGPQIKNFTKN